MKYDKFGRPIINNSSVNDEQSASSAGRYEQVKTDLAQNPSQENWNRFARLFAQLDAIAD